MAQNSAKVSRYTAGSLADGQVATTVGTIYTASASVIVRAFILYNSNAATQTTNVYVTRSGGTRRQLYRFSLAQYESITVLSGGEILALSSGDIIEADTTTSTAVDYLIAGETYA
jgi:hypothetical protein